MQWRLSNSGCQLDAYKLQNPTTRKHTKPRLIRSGCCKSKWFSQWPLLSEKQLGDKEISTYFNCDVILRRSCSCWCCELEDGVLLLMKLILMQMMMLLLLLFEGDITACVFTFITNHFNTTRAIWRDSPPITFICCTSFIRDALPMTHFHWRTSNDALPMTHFHWRISTQGRI